MRRMNIERVCNDNPYLSFKTKRQGSIESFVVSGHRRDSESPMSILCNKTI